MIFLTTNRPTLLHKLPLPVLGLDPHLPVLVDTSPAGLQYRRRGDRVPQGREALGVEVLGRQLLCVHRPAAVHELLERDIPISARWLARLNAYWEA